MAAKNIFDDTALLRSLKAAEYSPDALRAMNDNLSARETLGRDTSEALRGAGTDVLDVGTGLQKAATDQFKSMLAKASRAGMQIDPDTGLPIDPGGDNLAAIMDRARSGRDNATGFDMAGMVDLNALDQYQNELGKNRREVSKDIRAGQTLKEELRKNKASEAQAATAFKSLELERAIDNARLDEAAVDARDQNETTNELAAAKFAEEKKNNKSSEARAEIEAANKSNKAQFDLETKIEERDYNDIKREREQNAFDANEKIRELNITAAELAQQVSIRKDTQSLKDNAILQPATKTLLGVINNVDSSVKQKMAAVREFRTAIGGVQGSAAIEQRIAGIISSGDNLELDEFNENFNTVNPATGFTQTQDLLLKLMNRGRKVPFTSLNDEKIKQSDFSPQVKKDFIRRVSKLQSAALGGRKSPSELRTSAASALSDDIAIATAFNSQAAEVAAKLEMSSQSRQSMLNQFGWTLSEIEAFNKHPTTAIPDRVVAKIKAQHSSEDSGDQLDPGDQDQLKGIINNVVTKIKTGLNFNKLKPGKQQFLNVAILQYLESTTFDAGMIQASNDFEINGNQIKNMSIPELLNGLQEVFPSGSSVGDLIRSSSRLAPDASNKDTGSTSTASVPVNTPTPSNLNSPPLSLNKQVDKYRQDNKIPVQIGLSQLIKDLSGSSTSQMQVDLNNRILAAQNRANPQNRQIFPGK